MHPFLPKYYGIIKDKEYLVIEFINSKTLAEIDSLNLNFDDKIKIIFELMIINNYQ